MSTNTTTPITTTEDAVTTISKTHAGTSGGGSDNGHHSHHAGSTSSAQILHWQKDLTTLSSYDGNLDGVMSPEMQQSVRLLQGDAGLPQTGTWTTPPRQP